MTYSIVAKDETTGAIGIVVASRFFACGAMVPFVARDVAVASQAFCNPIWGIEVQQATSLQMLPRAATCLMCHHHSSQIL